ncbi:aspartate aminotransferase family protein [Minwuia thermotolerans]|uniref:Aspartate aminotransferase family protein n=1 Tax=Minwuia thermotolerans TaxID=2056226 RepID=A0A2M9G1F3_9PROT|nr:aspartate aminotransferase family protein [Minwuia thermotolerans]PJK29547.1 aspartate aminotransferase family protein [Minwuia thermotolerans]
MNEFAPRHGRNQPSSMFFWPTADRPVAVRGEGIFIWDDEGRRYVDASCGPQTTNIGHNNRRVVEAMRAQMDDICFAFRSHFKNGPAETLADRLADLGQDKGLTRAFFCSGGSEAVEGAIKLARQYALAKGEGTRYKIISRLPSYHGSTLGALSLTGDPAMFAPFAPMMQIQPKIPAPFVVERPEGESEDAAALRFAQALEDEIINQGPSTVLAFIMEPIGGAATGGLIAPDVYYARVREICDRHGLLLIYDEVMCGSGRSGKYLCAEHWDANPDIIAMAKGLAAGYVPLGAVLARGDMVEAVYDAGGYAHGHTYSAGPLACAAGLAVMDVLMEDGLVANAARQGAKLKAALEGLMDEFPFIGEVRGRGLMLGFDVMADRKKRIPLPPELNAGSEIAQACYDRGLIIYSRRMLDGLRGDHFLVTPPLNVTDEEIGMIVDLLRQGLGDFAPKAAAATR